MTLCRHNITGRIALLLCACAVLYPTLAQADPLAVDGFDYAAGELSGAKGGVGFQQRTSGWKPSARGTARVIEPGLTYEFAGKQLGSGRAVEIRGHGDRDNPLRRQLAAPYAGDELFVRFLLRYDAAAIDQASGTSKQDDGEFFVLWLDDIDGSDGATHNTNVPNIGLHVPTSGPDKNKNLLMVRIGSDKQKFTKTELEGDRTYLIVGRLAKGVGGARDEYSSFSIWVDPQPDDKARPLAASQSQRGLNLVEWVGFATGRKTEKDDRIVVDELAIGPTWESVLGLPEVAPTRPTPSPSLTDVDFRRDVFPILKSRCFECHQGEYADSGVRLDVREEVLGHSSGSPAVVPGKSGQSRLIELISAADDVDERMPPDGERLPKQEVELLTAWIDQGMAWDEALLPSPAVESDHWAFQPIERPTVPKVKDADWVRNPIDALIAAGYESQQLSPAPEASSRALLRRLSFDLTGLPPSPEEMDQFAADTSDDAYDRAVERLLNTPEYGERWGRHWLDVARWAESNGYQHNNVRKHSWRYRDYVVSSFNADKPYDVFLREQIAGDQIEPHADDHIIATGFLAAARVSGNEMNPDIRRNDIVVDMVNATASGVLGLTMQCAQCHNHKFDPISARDYYRFGALFAKGQLGNLVLPEAWARSDPERQRKPVDRPQTFGFYAPRAAAAQLQRLPMENIRYPLPYNPSELANEKAYLLVRGDVDSRGPVVEPGWPAVFGQIADQSQVNERPRLALANWLTARDNPLTARVWVNRIWHYHFGRGLVAETNDFGVRTESPVQRDLLDWLAVELIESGWRTKHIHRLIVASSTYRQSSQYNAKFAEIDPDNEHYWRFTPRRLEAEAIRDAVLAVSGELDPTRGGPSVTPDAKTGQLRRSLYLQQRRQKMPQLQTLFDGADGIVSCGRRRTSTVPLQPLYMLNSDFLLARARAFAERVAATAGSDPKQQAVEVFRLALGRAPDDEELAKAMAFLRQEDAERQLVQLCHAVMNLNEFVYLD